MVILMIIGIIGNDAEIIIEIVNVDRLSADSGAGRQRRRNAAPRCHHLRRWQVRSTKQLKEQLKEI